MKNIIKNTAILTVITLVAGVLLGFVYDITGNDFVFGPDYHTLVITAITIGTNGESRELELFNDLPKISA